MRSTPEVEEGNLLVERLRRQSLENKEKNDLIVKQKTLLNDQVRPSEMAAVELFWAISFVRA